MASNIVSVGKVEIVSLSDGRVESPAEVFFPTVPPEAMVPYADLFTEGGAVATNLGSFLVRGEGPTVMVDTGLGPDKQEPRDKIFGRLMDDMKTNGVDVDAVDLVVLTHVHRDHVGWNLVRDGASVRPTFPNARYRAPKADWEALQTPEGARMFPHVAEQMYELDRLGLLDPMEGEESLTPVMTAFPTPGHTPGHTSLLITSGGERCMILGDAAHHPVQVQEADWSPFVDVDPDHARRTRRPLMDRLEREGLLVVAGHFPAPGFGRVVRVDGKRVWQPL